MLAWQPGDPVLDERHLAQNHAFRSALFEFRAGGGGAGVDDDDDEFQDAWDDATTWYADPNDPRWIMEDLLDDRLEPDDQIPSEVARGEESALPPGTMSAAVRVMARLSEPPAPRPTPSGRLFFAPVGADPADPTQWQELGQTVENGIGWAVVGDDANDAPVRAFIHHAPRRAGRTRMEAWEQAARDTHTSVLRAFGVPDSLIDPVTRQEPS